MVVQCYYSWGGTTEWEVCTSIADTTTSGESNPFAPLPTTSFDATAATPTGSFSDSVITSTATLPTGSQNPTSSAKATSQPASDVSKKSDGVSKGAVAGIAIAMLLVGAVLAFAAAFFLFKRRKRSHPIPQYDSHADLIEETKPRSTAHVRQLSREPLVSMVSISAPIQKEDINLASLHNSSDFLAEILPKTADEKSVKGKVEMLFEQLHGHVENFYRDVQANITPSMENELAQFGTRGAGLVEMLQNASSPMAAIKHALVAYVLNITSPGRDGSGTLFPEDVVGVGGRDQLGSSPDQSAVTILYKRLSVYMHTSNPTTAPSRVSDIREAAEHFSLTFFPWAKPDYTDQEKDEHLQQIIGSALDLSIWLYGQPFVYEYIWDNGGRSGTVIAPGLGRVSDSRGIVGEFPAIVLEPAVVLS